MVTEVDPLFCLFFFSLFRGFGLLDLEGPPVWRWAGVSRVLGPGVSSAYATWYCTVPCDISIFVQTTRVSLSMTLFGHVAD